MSTMARTLRDSTTMARRNLRRQVRLSLIVYQLAVPVVLLLLFVYVLGGTMGDGLGVPEGGRSAYLAFVTPGILLIAIAGGATNTAIAVTMDMTEGIISRFRTMSIARGSVLTGHVVVGVLQAVAVVAVVAGLAVLLGFRPTAGPLEWLAVAGVSALIALAMTWLSVALGLVAKSVESASNLPMPLMLLPFLGSGFVPVESMPTGMRWFAEYQPFTPMIDLFRGLLTDAPIGNSAVVTIAWSLGIALASYLWARRSYERVTDR
ncbi:ABC transporter permease [Egibacter rhizosphaerae]|uniref:Transport permease protein n=1 Tax=Egibacter rhizosphaerae TaxID=1670831 RepID=A0A411YB31_9ACTN|nr:ABC transporter permease [Egibacter rhizosphaerae]QBI18453.1 ABC transporter permease [Egibacter rhizosphaerae]